MTLLSYAYAVIANTMIGLCLAAISVAAGYLIAAPERVREDLDRRERRNGISLPPDAWIRLCAVGRGCFTTQTVGLLAIAGIPMLSPWVRLTVLLLLWPGSAYLAWQWHRAYRVRQR